MLKRVAEMLVVTAIGTVSNSCLIGKEWVELDQELEPFSPSAIIQDPGLTTPLPGRLLLLNTQTGQARQTFQVSLVRADDKPLEVRLFVNRPRGCNPEENGSCNNAVLTRTILSAPANTRRTFTFERTFAEGTCSRLDLYISPEFHNEPERQTEPVRRYDVAHIRWFVATRDANTAAPSVEACLEP